MKKYSLLLTGCLMAAVLSAQTRKTLEAAYRTDLPEIDGVLSESCWQAVPSIGDFVTSTPVFGETPHCRTEVRLFYTETALYLAAWCFDPDAGGIRRDGGIRDGELTGDWFQLSIDTWNDDRLSFDFTVSAAGIQQDVREGSGWDANWQSAVAYQSDGWTLEMRIPFTALRYTRKPEQTWGVQFTRFDRSRGETSTWNPQDPLVQDRVWQFGTLTGLKDIRQEKRHALAIHSNTGLQLPDVFYSSRLTQAAGLDARLGLSESATLDVTVLPPLSVGRDYDDRPFSIERNVFGNAALPWPRQLLAEESGLFRRGNGSLEPNPVINPFQVSWREPLPAGFAFRRFYESKLLNAVKFTGRTKGRWRMGAYHATLGPVKAEIMDFASSSSFSRKTVTYQQLSAYNYLTAEYVLPNNGYARISNAALLAGRNMHTILPGADFRLRNRANSLEIRGDALLTLQERDTVRSRGYEYQLALARINRRWGWQLTHRDQSQAFRPFLLEPGLAAGLNVPTSSASVNFRDFQPRGPWLNRSGWLGLSAFWAAPSGGQNIWNLEAVCQVLDKRWRSFTLGASLIPHRQIIRYENSGAYITQQVAPRVGLQLGVASDVRRRFRIANTAKGWIHAEGKLPAVQDSFGISWVMSRHFTLSSALWVTGQLEELFLKNVPGKWVFEQHDFWSAFSSLQLNWYVRPRLRFWGSAGVSRLDYNRRQSFEFHPNGEFVPLTGPGDIDSDTYTDWRGELGFQYVISPLRQIRFHHRFVSSGASIITPPGFFPVTIQNASMTQLEIIYTLGGGGKAPKRR